MADDKSPLDRLLDVGVFAPLGFLISRDEVVADLAAAGRKQVAFSRSLGRAALKGLARSAGASTAAAGSPPTAEVPTSRAPTDAVPGYPDMTAKDVIALVAQATDAQVLWIRAAETNGKKRVTVLRALDRRAES